MAVLWDKKHKCWYIDVKIKLDDGTRYHTSYKDAKNSNLKSKTYAKALEKKIIDEKKEELLLVPSNDMKISNLMVLYLEDYRLDHAESSTDRVKEILKNHIIPILGANSKARDAFTINKMMKIRKTAIENPNLGGTFKNKVIQYARRFVMFAKKVKAINSDVKDDCLGVLDPVRNKVVLKEPRNKYTPMDDFLSAVNNSQKIKKIDKNSLIVFYFLGCRIGEFLGITRDNFEDNKDSTSFIYINKQLDFKGRLTSNLKTNASYKKIPLNSLCADLIREIIELKRIREEGRLFPYSRTNFRRIVDRVFEEANLPHNTLHGLGRKSINTELYLAGADDKVRQTLLGQKDSLVNIEHYIDNEKALEKGAEFLNRFANKKE